MVERKELDDQYNAERKKLEDHYMAERKTLEELLNIKRKVNEQQKHKSFARTCQSYQKLSFLIH